MKFATGDRVRVRSIPSTCAYLHGQPGTVEGYRASHASVQGGQLCIVRLDHPQRPVENWPAIDVLQAEESAFER